MLRALSAVLGRRSIPSLDRGPAFRPNRSGSGQSLPAPFQDFGICDRPSRSPSGRLTRRCNRSSPTTSPPFASGQPTKSSAYLIKLGAQLLVQRQQLGVLVPKQLVRFHDLVDLSDDGPGTRHRRGASSSAPAR